MYVLPPLERSGDAVRTFFPQSQSVRGQQTAFAFRPVILSSLCVCASFRPFGCCTSDKEPEQVRRFPTLKIEESQRTTHRTMHLEPNRSDEESNMERTSQLCDKIKQLIATTKKTGRGCDAFSFVAGAVL